MLYYDVLCHAGVHLKVCFDSGNGDVGRGRARREFQNEERREGPEDSQVPEIERAILNLNILKGFDSHVVCRCVQAKSNKPSTMSRKEYEAGIHDEGDKIDGGK